MKRSSYLLALIVICCNGTGLHSEEDNTFNKCTWERDYSVRAECFKKPYITQKDRLAKILTDIESDLTNRTVADKLRHEQKEWEAKTEKDCKTDVLKNIKWVEKKDYIDRIENYVCKYNKINERISELSKYPYLNLTCYGTFPPGVTPDQDQAACRYFDDFDAENYSWLCPMNPHDCLCGKQAENIKSYVPNGLKIVAACDMKYFERGFFDGTIYLSGEYVINGKIERYESASGTGLYFYGNSEKLDHRDDFTLQKRDFIVFKFANENSAYEKLQVPALDAKNGCWSAQAKVKVNDLAVHSEETDAAGTWILNFDTIEVGEFSSCVAEG